jgi:hypothetical protein
MLTKIGNLYWLGHTAKAVVISETHQQVLNNPNMVMSVLGNNKSTSSTVG